MNATQAVAHMEVAGFPFLADSLAFIVLVYVLETVLDVRQFLRYRQHTVPAQLHGVVDEDTFRKSQAYNYDKSVFGFVRGFYGLLETVALFYFNGLPYVWNLARQILLESGFDESYEILQSLAFATLFYIINELLSLPWSIYSTFVIEARHGFNKTGVTTFITDKLKGALLFAIFTPPILSAFISIIQWGGDYFYVYVWAFMFALQLFLLAIYPTLIQPLFNKVEPLEEGPLRTKIEELAASTNFPLKKLYRIDGSKRSSHSNAYFYGFFTNKRIVLYDTLIEQCSNEEVVAILGHELGHYFLSHIIYNLVIIQLHLFVLFFSFGQIMGTQALYDSFGFHGERPIIIGFVLFSFLYSPVDHLISFFMNMFSRHNEFAADEFSAKLGKAADLCSGLITISKENLGNMNPDPLYSAYHFSHPPLVERLKALELYTKKVK